MRIYYHAQILTMQTIGTTEGIAFKKKKIFDLDIN